MMNGFGLCVFRFVRIIQHVAITLVYAQAGCLISQIDFGHSANVAEKFFLMACLYGYSMLTRLGFIELRTVCNQCTECER